ncbi:MAG TPA: hypothetical protein VF658_07025, partial [Pyrinomonadaceae bacterium]
MNMKQCSMCQEEFADKFTFCPIDGTPLSGLSASTVAPSLPDSEETVPSTPSANESFTANTADNETPIARESFAASETPAINSGAGADKGEYHLTIIEDAGITRRLVGELRAVKQQSQLTWPDFKQDPAGFSRRLISG